MHMNVSRYVLTVFVGLAGLGLWYGLAHRKAPAETVTTVPTAISATPASPRATQSHEGTAETHGVAPSAIDYAKAFRASTNYRDFILQTLPAAQKGDRDAEYYLFAAIDYCDETNRFFFRRRDKTLSLDEAIAERARLPGNSMTERIRVAYSRCHDVNAAHAPPWGTADQWLSKATEHGQPMAQLRTAGNTFLGIVKTGTVGAPKPGALVEARTISDARSLARAGLESANANSEIIFEVGSLLMLLKPETSQADISNEMLTWQYVACQRGLDCGANAQWLLQYCLGGAPCLPGESGVDYLRRSAQEAHVVNFEEKAYALNAKIDAQAWDELGLVQ
jgi:hypothetical protein